LLRFVTPLYSANTNSYTCNIPELDEAYTASSGKLLQLYSYHVTDLLSCLFPSKHRLQRAHPPLHPIHGSALAIFSALHAFILQ